MKTVFKLLIDDNLLKYSFVIRYIIKIILALVLFVSCKTIQVKENWVFKETKYNYESKLNEINKSNFNQQKKDSLISLQNTIINTNNKDILNSKNILIERHFAKLDSINSEYYIFEPKNTEKIGLFFIGNASNIPNFIDDLIDFSLETNSRVYVLNYRGYGKSDGTPSFKTQFKDNSVFLNEILKKESKVDFVMGYSLGSVFATKLATENSIANLILLSPFSNTNEMIKHQKKVFTKGPKIIFRPFLRLKIENQLMNISNTNQIQNYNGNLSIFHGTEDIVIPYKMGINLFNSAKTNSKKIHTIKGGNHSSPFKVENWITIIKEVKILL